MKLTSAAGTHVGLIRPQNEDSYLCAEPLFAVADGLGGHAAGEVASALIVERLAQVQIADQTSPEDASRQLAEAVRDANRQIHQSARDDPEHAGMGTTVTAAVVVGDQMCFAHVGDSRGYLWRKGELQRLTEDHTPVQRAVRSGVISAEEALRHPSRHVLAQAVGLDVDVEVDTPIVQLQSGDRIILGTDGLTDPVPDTDMQRLLAGFDSAEATLDGLLRAALNGGGPDNVTIVVVDVS